MTKDEGRNQQVKQNKLVITGVSPSSPSHPFTVERRYSRTMNGNEAERVGTEAGVPVPGNGHDGGFGNPRRLNPSAYR
jgi:hypothetical protein